MYENAKAGVITLDGETEPFDISAGVLQGDILALYLFLQYRPCPKAGD